MNQLKGKFTVGGVSIYLSWLTFPCSQAKQGHLPACVENCEVIHVSLKHLTKGHRRV